MDRGNSGAGEFRNEILRLCGRFHRAAAPCKLEPQLPGRDGEIGRRSGLKIRRAQKACGGSIPPPGTSLLPSHEKEFRRVKSLKVQNWAA